ncbi:hypothetical protein [Nonomuraea sp. NPDC050310]
MTANVIHQLDQAITEARAAGDHAKARELEYAYDAEMARIEALLNRLAAL